MSRPNHSLEEILQSRTLPGLDGFRMLAVAAVVLYHAGIAGAWSAFGLTARHGVTGFFVLSGFLITWLLLRENEKAGGISLKGFFARRVLRIFPAYYFFVLVSFGWDALNNNSAIYDAIVPALFYLMNYHNALEGHSVSSLAHTWSLAVEEQFYLIWPWIFLGFMRLGHRRAMQFLIVFIAGVMLWRTIAYTVLELGPSYAYNAFDTRCDALFIGCLLAFLVKNQAVRSVLGQLSRYAWTPLVTLILLRLSTGIPSEDYAYGPGFTIDALLLAVFLIQLMVLSYNSVWWGWLNWKWVTYLGVISYPLYLWHIWGLQAGGKLNFLPEWSQTLLGIVAAIVLAMGSYHFIERPFLKLKGRFESTPAAAARGHNELSRWKSPKKANSVNSNA